MEQDLSTALRLLPVIQQDASPSPLANPALRLAESGPLQVCYAPFDHVETRARLAVVGVTPGLTQAVNAITAARSLLDAGHSVPEVLAGAKLTGSFSGAIRANLVAMLDAVGVARHFGVDSTLAFFAPGAHDIHFTSALRYPTFVGGRNYNGAPDMRVTPILQRMVETHLAEEAALLPQVLWLPLGPKAEAALRHLADLGRLDPARILAGMPHPSGANAERVAVFLGRKPPGAASRQTNAAALLAARRRLDAQISDLGKAA